jgi:hypothetical protein
VRPPARRSSLRWLRPAPALLVLALAAARTAAAAPAAAPYEPGQHVQFTGIVSDRQGQPLANVRVVLEAARSSFSLRQMRRADKDVRRAGTTTNAQGEYTLDWPWDDYFNRFELKVGVPVRKGHEEQLATLEQVDVTQRVLSGSPVVSALVVRNTEFIEKLRQFLAMPQSDDQRKVYDEMGRPDEVRTINYPDHTESSWWYFETGRAYRFRDGRLEQVIPFDPVRGF